MQVVDPGVYCQGAVVETLEKACRSGCIVIQVAYWGIREIVEMLREEQAAAKRE
jgi:hypothetical protein